MRNRVVRSFLSGYFAGVTTPAIVRHFGRMDPTTKSFGDESLLESAFAGSLGMGLDTLLHSYIPEPEDRAAQLLLYSPLVGALGSSLQHIMTAPHGVSATGLRCSAVEGALDALVFDGVLALARSEAPLDCVWAGLVSSAAVSTIGKDRSMVKAGRAAVGGGVFWAMYMAAQKALGKR